MASRGILSIAVLLAATIAPPLSGAALVGCAPVDTARFAAIEPGAAIAGFPGWSSAVGYALDRLPMTPTLLAVGPIETCDLTHSLASFLGARAAPTSADDAILVARLAVGALFVDVLPDPVVRSARAAPVEGGFVVDLQVWTARNGVVADTTVRLDGRVSAGFRVVERAQGDFVGTTEGWDLQPGMTHDDLGDGGEGPSLAVLTASNADGTSWRVTYNLTRYASPDVAEFHARMHLDAALAAYANGTSWGFASRDPDGVLDLVLDGCACIAAKHDAEIRMFPRASDIYGLLPHLAYRTDPELAQLILGHELFHHYQYGIQEWRLGLWLVEGMARLTESLNQPDATFLPTTILYEANPNGMNGFMLNPSRYISQHAYDWSLVWGWLYAHEGGVALLKAVLEETSNATGDPNVYGPAAIQRAMDRVPGGEHATFAESYRAFAQALFTRTGFTWGAPDGTQVHDWATYLVPVARADASGPAALPLWGIRLHDARPLAPERYAVVAWSPNPLHDAVFARVVGKSVDFAPAAAVNVVVGVDDAVLLLTRTTHVPMDSVNAAGTYAVHVQR